MTGRRLAGHLDAVGARHDDVGQQQVVGAVLQGVDGVVAVLAIDDLMAGPLQRPRQEAAQRAVVFGQEDTRHWKTPLKQRASLGPER